MVGVKEKKRGLAPVYSENSRVLILGSFPSVKSRETEFYYGHKQNRFWKTLFGYFGENVAESVEDKKEFLLQKGIALWDMVVACDIKGSSDASIQRAEIADLNVIFSVAKIEKILLNGALAERFFLECYQNIEIPYQRMPSTSPANPRFNESVWKSALDDVFISKNPIK